METCETCRFWKFVLSEGDGLVIGECRRNAPSPETSHMGATFELWSSRLARPCWPTTRDSQWCGEWEAKR